MALSFNDIYERVKPFDGPRPTIAMGKRYYAKVLLYELSLLKADGIDVYTLLDEMTDLLEEGDQ